MQTDDHIPQLSVHETLAFAHTCQTSRKETFNVVDAIREARARNKDSNLPRDLSFLKRQHAEVLICSTSSALLNELPVSSWRWLLPTCDMKAWSKECVRSIVLTKWRGDVTGCWTGFRV